MKVLLLKTILKSRRPLCPLGPLGPFGPFVPLSLRIKDPTRIQSQRNRPDIVHFFVQHGAPEFHFLDFILASIGPGEACYGGQFVHVLVRVIVIEALIKSAHFEVTIQRRTDSDYFRKALHPLTLL